MRLARERESGTLRTLLAQGVGPRQIVAGKLLALAGVAALVLLPALLAPTWIGAATAAPPAWRWCWCWAMGSGC